VVVLSMDGAGAGPCFVLTNQQGIRTVSKRFSAIRAAVCRSEGLPLHWNRGVRSRVPVNNVPRTAPRSAGLDMSGEQP
jgi:hypothetical protein